jgi:large subunit ribosomal protein L29
MKAEKLRELDENELNVQSNDIHEQLFRLRFQISMGQTDGLKKYRVIKKDRARMLGILRERELDPAKAQAAAEAAAKKPARKKAAAKAAPVKAAVKKAAVKKPAVKKEK